MRNKINWEWKYINEYKKIHAINMHSMQSACGNYIKKIATPYEYEEIKCKICKRCIGEKQKGSQS